MKPKLYFTADWHIGHQNVLKFDNRPYPDLQTMHEALIKNFNMLVPNHGITIFAGDMGLCSNGLLKSIMDKLNGTKVLVRGNHDGNMYSMYAAGFDVVTDKFQFNIGQNIVTVTHCPLQGIMREDTTNMVGAIPGDNWHKETWHKDKFSIEDFGQFHLHGHIHSPNKGKSKKILDRQMDIGVPAWNYKPVPIAEVESFIAKYHKNQTDSK